MSQTIISYRIDATDFLAKSKAIAAMPEAIRSKVLTFSFRAVSRASESRIVKLAATETSMRQKDVRERIKTIYSDHDVTHIVKSAWIPLAKLGAVRQTRTGVTVRGWGAHRQAFVVASIGGNVFKRYGPKVKVGDSLHATRTSRYAGQMKQRIRMLYGPNPANHINTHPDHYRRILEDEAERRLLPEVERLLDRAFVRM